MARMPTNERKRTRVVKGLCSVAEEGAPRAGAMVAASANVVRGGLSSAASAGRESYDRDAHHASALCGRARLPRFSQRLLHGRGYDADEADRADEHRRSLL